MNVRRCFSGKITESDSFYTLPGNAQALYLHLCMQADDDGFVNNAAGVAIRIFGGREALKILVERRFLLQFGEVYVIKHWKISNSLKSDRIRSLNYEAIARNIWVKRNRAYTDHPAEGSVSLYTLRMRGGEEVSQSEKTFQNGIQNGGVWIPNRTEEKRTEEKGTEEKETAWGEILKEYPQERLGNTEEAYRAFCQSVQDEGTGARMLANLRLWKQSQQWEKEGGRYIPQLANWIARGAWQRKPEALAIPKGASGELGEAELEAIRKVLRDETE